ncbi:DUF4349 domain-containing protein [Metabacillus malikii]|uniref:Uncharacterized lipoprotein YehR (DUF1307 family) n=1 Tax=Metabacillus malikii TaxID=1504265 RepID=A0ABT9ZHS9_9BACI|nr:DUF4349 domain-containing protein [Metabacillus malikii]MDQ0231352.1 uncharacterized lipoprotein YehR (DUF1307 family) [Metabacillus malikii]
MKRYVIVLLVIICFFSVTACNNQYSKEESKQSEAVADSSSRPAEKAEIATENNIQTDRVVSNEANTDKKQTNHNQNRMVIYTGNLSIHVKNFDDIVALVQDELAHTTGYIVDSQSYTNEGNTSREGTITVRIPQDKFNRFIESVESGSTKVIDRSISGQDVTEEYVDLESRLKSKQVVEKRLLEFMEKAEKTEDLLKISTDLATVQEEIEQLKGRMTYLNHQVALATVTIHVKEEKVKIPTIESDHLNTWEKTKERFMESINFILKIGSGLIIFIVGGLPVLLIITVLTIAIYLFTKKKRNNRNLSSPSKNDDEDNLHN